MVNSKNQSSRNESSIDLLRGKIVFSKSDKPDYKLKVLLIVSLFLILIICIMKAWAIPFLTANGITFVDFIRNGKGNSP